MSDFNQQPIMQQPVAQPEKKQKEYSQLSLIPSGIVLILTLFGLYSILDNPRYIRDSALFLFIILPLMSASIISALALLRKKEHQDPEVRRMLLAAIIVNLSALALPVLSGIIYAFGLSE